MPKIAWTSRATPRMESRSARLEVTSSSSTSWTSGRRAASGSPGRHPLPSTMMPSPSDEMSSSRSDRIMPSEVSPRSLERAMRRPSSNAVPGSATATVSPAAKFQAPQTIDRGEASPTSTWHNCRRSAFGCLPASSTCPATISSPTPSCAGSPRRSTPSTLSPANESRSMSSSSGGSSARWSDSHCSGTFIARPRGTAPGSGRRCRRSS